VTAAGRYALIKTITLPGQPLSKFDIGWVDDLSRSYYLADRSNCRVVVVNVDRAEYSNSLGAGRFTGAAESSAKSGPNGVAVLPAAHEVWAGDGDSTVKIIDIDSGDLIDNIQTGGTQRVDELAYDEVDEIVLVANDKEPIPFVTMISARPGHEVLGKIEFPRASKGLHQPVWSSTTGRFYLPVTEVDGQRSVGEITAIDPRRMQITATYPVTECQPAGLSMGPDQQLCIGCSKAAVVAGFAPRSLIMDVRTGELLATIKDVGGSDEVWYNPGTGHYYLAAAGMTGGPVLGIIDASSLTWVENVPTAEDSHSVAADARTNRVFVPVIPGTDAPNGGIAVYELRAG
jgi:DNA-binding beta-propeller fold protein YncE